MFVNARPIWVSGEVAAINSLTAYRTVLTQKGDAELLITAVSFYRAYLDGKFIGYGPARTAKKYARVDRLPLKLDGGEHVLTIEAIGFHCQSLSTARMPSFLIAEVILDGESVAWTGRDFEAFVPAYHERVVDRYSIQRHFTEVCDLRRGDISTDPACHADVAVLYPNVTFLERGVPYPNYDTFSTDTYAWCGKLIYDEKLAATVAETYSKPLTAQNIRWIMYAPDEIPSRPFPWLFSHSQQVLTKSGRLPIELCAGEYALLDFSQIETCFLSSTFEAIEESDVVIAWSEYFEGDQFAIKNSTKNVVEYFAGAGQKVDRQTFEPFSMRFVLVAVRSGRIKLTGVGGMRFEHPVDGVEYPDLGNDLRNLIYRASVRTLAQNSVDLFMDCPSRERAGWLCDSYFTGRAERELFGNNDVERAFLENFRLYQNEGEIPEGALPMCYPGDFINNNDFIPQWDMWYILEVEEYLTIRCPDENREQFRASVMGVLDFLSRYENSDGLLENLPSWNFVEWSRANKWTKDVNYPTNFLYAYTLRAAYNLYGGEELLEKSRRVAAEAKRQSFNGTLFTDHAIRGEDGTLTNAGDISEICQYYALLFADIDPNAPEYAELLRMVHEVFCPDRVATPEFDVEPINAFIGVYLRMETLLRLGSYKLALADCEAFFGGMAQKTLTLWENRTLTGSCNHGFASFAAVVMKRCLENL